LTTPKHKQEEKKETGAADDGQVLPPLPVVALHPGLVVVHPLVLLSVVDHYNRVAKVRA